jgi:hypothetical protein
LDLESVVLGCVVYGEVSANDDIEVLTSKSEIIRGKVLKITTKFGTQPQAKVCVLFALLVPRLIPFPQVGEIAFFSISSRLSEDTDTNGLVISSPKLHPATRCKSFISQVSRIIVCLWIDKLDVHAFDNK